MKQEGLHDALNYLDDELIENVDTLRVKKKTGNQRLVGVLSLAACLCVLFGAVLTREYWLPASEILTNGASPEKIEVDTQPGKNQVNTNASGAIEAGAYIPPMEVNLDNDALGDMVCFFIYGGRCYTQYARSQNTKLVGQYLGTATGTIDEWTSTEGYVELAGSISGDFYAVNGYDSGFLLCMYDGEEVQLFINDNDIFLKTGADLFANRLHVEGNYLSVGCLDVESMKEYVLPEENKQAADGFLQALNAGAFCRSEEIPLRDPWLDNTYIETAKVYSLEFQMKDGFSVGLWVYENGYVCFNQMFSVCVQVEQDVVDNLLAAFGM